MICLLVVLSIFSFKSYIETVDISQKKKVIAIQFICLCLIPVDFKGELYNFVTQIIVTIDIFHLMKEIIQLNISS
jgi:hypothetical protein